MPSYYEVLGVPPDADRETIRTAYVRAARASPTSRTAPTPLDRKLDEAYAVLGDPVRRQRYDELCESPQSSGSSAELLAVLSVIADTGGIPDAVDVLGPAPPPRDEPLLPAAGQGRPASQRLVIRADGVPLPTEEPDQPDQPDEPWRDEPEPDQPEPDQPSPEDAWPEDSWTDEPQLDEPRFEESAADAEELHEPLLHEATTAIPQPEAFPAAEPEAGRSDEQHDDEQLWGLDQPEDHDEPDKPDHHDDHDHHSHSLEAPEHEGSEHDDQHIEEGDLGASWSSPAEAAAGSVGPADRMPGTDGSLRTFARRRTVVGLLLLSAGIGAVTGLTLAGEGAPPARFEAGACAAIAEDSGAAVPCEDPRANARVTTLAEDPVSCAEAALGYLELDGGRYGCLEPLAAAEPSPDDG
jgi:curved DNA-binding protein CbpA